MAKTETLSPATVSRSWLPRLDGGTALMALLIGVMGFIVVYPLVLILINSFNTATIAEPPVYGLKAWREAFSEYGIWRSLWNSVKIGIVLQVLALPLGIFLSWLLARTNILFANVFEFGFWISFFLPSLATTFGWMLMLDPSTGLINAWLRQLPFLSELNFDIYSFSGIIWVHLVSTGLSTKVMLMTPAFRRMDASMEEASRMSGASAFTTLWRITVPAMTPVIVVVFLLSVIRIFSSFEIELLLGVPWSFYVYSTKIVDLARQEPPLVNQAAALGSIILIFLAAFIPIQRRLITRRQFTTVTGHFKPKVIDLGVWRYPATAFVAFVVFLLDVVPLLSVVGGITLATQILKANFIQLGKELEESSRMSGAGFWRTYLRIVFPLMAQTMVLVAVIKFMFAAQHNSAIILLATSETRTLSLLALDQVAAGYREVASITIILVTSSPSVWRSSRDRSALRSGSG